MPHHCAVSFDPNIRLKLWKVQDYTSLMLDCISRASYLLAGRDECKILYHTDDARMAEDAGADFMLSPSANPADYLKSGFVGVGIGGSLVDAETFRQKKWDEITRSIQNFLNDLRKEKLL